MFLVRLLITSAIEGIIVKPKKQPSYFNKIIKSFRSAEKFKYTHSLVNSSTKGRTGVFQCCSSVDEKSILVMSI